MTSYACHQLNEARPFVFHYQGAATPTHFSVITKFQVTKGRENSIDWSWTSCLAFLQHLTRVLRTNQTKSISLFSDFYVQFPKWHMAWVTLCDCCALTRKHNLIIICPSSYTNTWVDVVLRYPINTWITLTSKSAKQSKGRVWWTVCRNTYNREKRLYTKITH